MSHASSATATVRVIKLGGSLLDLPDLPDRFRRWLARQPAASNVIVAGGGPLADFLRDADRIHNLDEVAVHWLCVESLTITAQLVALLLPEARLVRGLREVREHLGNGSTPQIFDPQGFVRENGHRARHALPPGWEVTSDSIAARVAWELAASELVLLKSAAPPASTLDGLAAMGYVDASFPRAAAELSVRIVNLRAAAENCT
jgi:aspartokinase-like uncharacterized kinase